MAKSSDRVVIDFQGRCCCPYHGRQDFAVEYVPGDAPCGCQWILAADGVTLRAQRPAKECVAEIAESAQT